MMSWNEPLNYFDVWYFWSYRHDVNRLKTTIGQQIWGHNKDSELEVYKNSFFGRKTMILQNSSPKYSFKLLSLILDY